MYLTVAICTHNRCALLRQTLRSVSQLEIPIGCTWEVVVVANACSDDTDRVLSEFSHRLPMRVLHERRPGHSHARNRAVRAAAGEYILWTDDDVLVEPAWLAEYAKAFEQRPDAAFFGGPITPVFEGSPPQWLVELLPVVGPAFARRELGGEPCQLDRHSLPYGANLALKTSAQRRYLYDPALGQRPGQLGIGEETKLLLTLLNDGERGWWVPGARVSHFIPVARQRWAHIHKHWRAQGQAMALTMSPVGGPRILGRPFRLWEMALRAELTYRWHRLTSPRTRWVRDQGTASIMWSLLRAASTPGDVSGQ